jgi:hypothetical protein
VQRIVDLGWVRYARYPRFLPATPSSREGPLRVAARIVSAAFLPGLARSTRAACYAGSYALWKSSRSTRVTPPSSVIASAHGEDTAGGLERSGLRRVRIREDADARGTRLNSCRVSRIGVVVLPYEIKYRRNLYHGALRIIVNWTAMTAINPSGGPAVPTALRMAYGFRRRRADGIVPVTRIICFQTVPGLVHSPGMVGPLTLGFTGSGHSCCWSVEFREALGSRDRIHTFGRVQGIASAKAPRGRPVCCHGHEALGLAWLKYRGASGVQSGSKDPCFRIRMRPAPR